MEEYLIMHLINLKLQCDEISRIYDEWIEHDIQ